MAKPAGPRPATASLTLLLLLPLLLQPAFVFDGRNLLDHAALRKLGFVVYALGKPLDPYLTDHTMA